MTSFTKNTSNLFLTIFIGLIVVSFLVTGYGTLQGTPDTVVNVGGIPVKITEYQREYQRQTEFYKRIFGGKDLTRAQIEQFKIKDNTIRNLVQRKLLVKISDDMGIFPSDTQIKEEIKKLPYFLTNGSFDINKYKQLLAGNGFTPLDFETNFKQDLKGQLANEVLTSFPASDAYFTALEKFKEQEVNVNLATIKKDELKAFVSISNKEVKDFLSKKENQERVANLYKQRKAGLDNPAQVKASHILLRAGADADPKKVEAKAKKIRASLTSSNFAKKADELTEDPSGKGKGGDLGFFTKDKMVPEFANAAFAMKVGEISQPIKTSFGYHIIKLTGKKKAVVSTLKEHESKIAKELISDTKTEEHKKLIASLSTEVSKALKANNKRSLDALEKKYPGALKIVRETQINRLEGAGTEANLTAENLKELFATKELKSFNWDSFATVLIAQTLPSSPKATKKDAKDEEDSLEKIQTTSKLAWGRKYLQEALKDLEENIKVTVNDNILR
ncbi:MAG: peptidyl-prolyl cis-trans isomerase D [Bacteriovoracaceae bacterium]|jgi:peptidyl-prolyl cis-trans isomerase D